MKLGMGFYRHLLTRGNFAFARQIGVTQIVAHLVDYFRAATHGARDDYPSDTDRGWGLVGDSSILWTLEEFLGLRLKLELAGLTLGAVENLNLSHFNDMLFDGPQRRRHIGNVKTTIRRVGQAAIPVLGYNYRLAVAQVARKPVTLVEVRYQLALSNPPIVP